MGINCWMDREDKSSKQNYIHIHLSSNESSPSNDSVTQR